jgi:hypothetical protein
LKRLLSRADAERIAKRLVALAKSGDLQAVRLLLDRLDGPLSQATAVALATTQTAVMPPVDSVSVSVVIADNHRNDRNSKPVDLVGCGALAPLPVETAPAPAPAPDPMEPEHAARILAALA